MLSLDILAIISTFIPTQDLCSFMCSSKACASAALTLRTGGMTKINTSALKAALLFRACRDGLTVTTVSLLRDPRANVNVIYTKGEDEMGFRVYVYGCTPLTVAIANNHWQICQILLNDKRLYSVSKDPMPLLVAVFHEREDIVLLLLYHKAPVTLPFECEGDIQYTCLHMAAITGNLGIMKMLIQNGADLCSMNPRVLGTAKDHPNKAVYNYLKQHYDRAHTFTSPR